MSKLLSQNEVIDLFIKHLPQHGFPGIKLDYRPDEQNRNSKDIDAIAGPLAIEHTSIDTVPNQRRYSDWFLQVIKPLENGYQSKLPYRIGIILPYEGIQKGQDWSSITGAFREWIDTQSSKIPFSNRLQHYKDIPGIPFEFHVSKRESEFPGVIFSRIAPEDHTLPNRLKEQLDQKIEKLIPYKSKDKTTVLLVESDDIGLMNEDYMMDGLKAAYPNGLPSGLDMIWFADTSIPEEVLFYEMTGAFGI